MVSDPGLERWRAWTAGEFHCERLPGDHFFHLGAGQARLLALIAGLLGPST